MRVLDRFWIFVRRVLFRIFHSNIREFCISHVTNIGFENWRMFECRNCDYWIRKVFNIELRARKCADSAEKNSATEFLGHKNMSNFKRMQSRVFWGEMASRDATETLQLVPVSGANCYANLGMNSEESEESLRGSDASGENVTVVRIEAVASIVEETINRTPVQSPRQEAAPESRGRDRSLDSGFSDSERSNSPDVLADGTPRRRRRRRRSARSTRPRLAKRIHDRLSSLWRDRSLSDAPAHASTPKPERHRATERRSTEDKSNCRSEENKQEKIVESSTTRLEPDECLGDFLYASEPPEEDEDPRGISCVSPIASHSRGISMLDSRVSDRRENSVRAWLACLLVETEAECCTALQSKALPRRRYIEDTREQQQTRDLRMLTSSATAAATDLLVRADEYTRHLRRIVEDLSNSENCRSESDLIRSAEDRAFAILSELGAPPPRRIQRGNSRFILAQLDRLGSHVEKALDDRLDFYIERVVRGLEEAPEEGGRAARGALAALTALGLAGARASASIARCSGIRALLTTLVSAKRLSSELRASALRALASVCCCTEAIDRFVDDGGPEILADLLADQRIPEREKLEAAALVVQLTAPWTNASGLRHLEPFAARLVDFLTRLADRSVCSQTLLLSAAALNNLADSDKFVEPILREDAVRKLLQCVKKLSGGNVWLMEQVASLIGKLAKIPRARRHLAAARASVALICFLRMGTPGLEDAYGRLENTAAEALTRLCVDPEIARQVVAIGGDDCLPAYDHDRSEGTNLRSYRNSLRRACAHAAREINLAKASCDSPDGPRHIGNFDPDVVR